MSCKVVYGCTCLDCDIFVNGIMYECEQEAVASGFATASREWDAAPSTKHFAGGYGYAVSAGGLQVDFLLYDPDSDYGTNGDNICSYESYYNG